MNENNDTYLGKVFAYHGHNRTHFNPDCEDYVKKILNSHPFYELAFVGLKWQLDLANKEECKDEEFGIFAVFDQGGFTYGKLPICPVDRNHFWFHKHMIFVPYSRIDSIDLISNDTLNQSCVLTISSLTKRCKLQSRGTELFNNNQIDCIYSFLTYKIADKVK